MSARRIKAHFVEPMLLLRTEMLPAGGDQLYELKFDGFRAEAIKTGGTVFLRSRNNKDFNGRHPSIACALTAMPDETVIDGEIVAMDPSGRPSFNALQNYGTNSAPLLYYVFDLIILAGADVTAETLETRRRLLAEKVFPKLSDPIRESPQLDAALPDLIQSIKAQGLEGLVAKRRDSRHEPAVGRVAADTHQSGACSRDLQVTHLRPGTFDAIIFG